MTDIRRMNVGLTRAKSSLWILGDSRALVQGEFWKKLIEDARARDCYTSGDILSKFRKPLEQSPNASEMASRDSTPAQTNNEDVAMHDVPSQQRTSSGRTEPPRPNEGSVPGLGVGNLAPALPRSDGPPIIHTSADKPQAPETKKRALDGSEAGQPGAKRVCPIPARQLPDQPQCSNNKTDCRRRTPIHTGGQVWTEAKQGTKATIEGTAEAAEAAYGSIGDVSFGDDAARAAPTYYHFLSSSEDESYSPAARPGIF